MSRDFRILTAVLIVAFVASGFLAAQVLTGRVDGTVKDTSDAVIPGATVTLTNLETNASKTVLSGDTGVYVFPQVLAGTYSVSGELTGFKVKTVQGVKVDTGKPVTVDLILELGDITEEVVVASSVGQLLQTVSAEINTIVSRDQIEELPLNGRNPMQLAYLQAGITGRTEISREGSVNGMRGSFNNLTLDGINNQDNFIRTDGFFGTIPVRESFVEEFNVTTSNSDAASGLGASQTQFVTRSGTNEYHGSVYYFHQNEALNANEFFNKAAEVDKPKLRDHMYGGTVGGPVLKDKLFFFVGLEKEKVPQTISITRSVFTQQARNGQFSYTRADNGQRETVNLFELSGLSPDPVMNSLIGLTPAPNDPTSAGLNVQNFRFNSEATTDQDWAVFRVDYEINESHSIVGSFHQFRYNLQNDAFNDIGSMFPGLPGAGQQSTRRLGSYAWLGSFGPNFTNELRFGFQRAPVDFFTTETFASGYDLDFDVDNEVVDNPVRDFLSQGRNSPVIDIMESANWVRGSHTFNFGGSYRWVEVDLYNDAGIVPTYTLGFGTGSPFPIDPSQFPGGLSSSSFDEAERTLQVLAGVVDEGTQTFNVTSTTSGFVDGATEARLLKQNFFSFFGGDTWRVTPTVTLNYGLRWEWQGVPYEAKNLALLPKNTAISAVLDPNAILDFAGPGVGRPFFQDDGNNFAPNVGVAWRFSPRSVIRAGYSLNYVIDNNMTTVRNAFIGNDGLRQTQSLFGITGTVSSGGIVGIPEPEFLVPRTARDNILADSTSALFTINPDLRVPYVQQWNVGFQHELFRDLAIEVRYVGNHGVKLSRALDLNQVMFPQEFVEDFKRAQRNIAANGSPTAGEPLTYFPRFGAFALCCGVSTLISNGEIGQVVGGFYAPNRMFFFAGEGGEAYGADATMDQFYRNPNTWPGDAVDNNAFSKYHGLQMEVRRRFRDGFTGQLNYTIGKVLTNYAGSQTNFRGYFDNAQQNLEIMRPDFDITHTINGNFIYQLPLGYGRRYLNQGGFVDAVLGGWNMTGIFRIRSGETVNITSGRGTINRGGARATTNSAILSGLTIQELQEKTGTFRDSQGRIRLFDPSLIGSDGRANPQYLTNPGLLEAGTLALSPVSGPWYSSFDLGVRKSFRLPITEVSRAEIRFDFFNIFNRPNFNVTTTLGANPNLDLGMYNRHVINNTDFGVIDDTFAAREMQVGLKIVF